MQIRKVDENNFLVIMDDKEFKVFLNDAYWQKLTNGKFSKEELIKKSFEFLLDREPVSSILQEFPLQLIQRYFPEFEEKIEDYLT